MIIVMENKYGVKKRVKDGFCFHTFFFGWIPSLLRRDVISALKLFVLGNMSFGLYTVFKSISINEEYKEFLLEKGYEEIAREKGGFDNRIVENLLVGVKAGVIAFILAFGIGSLVGMFNYSPKVPYPEDIIIPGLEDSIIIPEFENVI